MALTSAVSDEPGTPSAFEVFRLAVDKIMEKRKIKGLKRLNQACVLSTHSEPVSVDLLTAAYAVPN